MKKITLPTLLLIVFTTLFADGTSTTNRFQFTKTTSHAGNYLSFTNVAFPDGAGVVCYNQNPVITGNNIYAADLIRMSNYWRCYNGGWLNSGQVNDRIYLSTSSSMNLEGPWTTPQLMVSEGPYVHVNDPSVAVKNGVWYMVYSAAGFGDDTINYSTSTDGINWSPSVAETNTALTIVDPNNIANAQITDVARPSIVFAPDCVKLWFDGFLTNNGGAIEEYLAEASYTNMTYFVVRHKYGNTGFPRFYEPDVVLRGDGTYQAVYNWAFSEIRFATSEDGINFTDVNVTPVKVSDPDFPYTYINNPGLFYDQLNDVNYGIAFGMTLNSHLTDNKIGVGFMQYNVNALDINGTVLHTFQAGASSAEQQSLFSGLPSQYNSFSKFYLKHPVTGQTLCEQEVSSAVTGEVWQLNNSSIQIKAWTDDNNSLISPARTYTHKINLNNPADVTINNITFDTLNSGIISGSNWSLMIEQTNGTFGWLYDSKPTYVSGNSSNLVRGFCFDSTAGEPNPTKLKLTGLIPGKEYLLNLYSKGYESGGRWNEIAGSDGASLLIDQDDFGTGNGLLTSYRYLAQPDGTFTFRTKPTVAGWHWYAFANVSSDVASPTSTTASQGNYSNFIEVNWSGYQGAEYKLYRSTNSDLNSAVLISVNITNTFYDDYDVAQDVYYHYWPVTVIIPDESAAGPEATGWLVPEPLLCNYLSIIICYLLIVKKKLC